MKKLIDSIQLKRMILRIAYQLMEDFSENELAIIGVREGGIVPAKVLKAEIEKLSGCEIPYGELSISMYKESTAHLFNRPVLNATHIPFSLKDKIAVIVDDVVYSGQTGFEAIDALLDISKPRAIKLVALIETGMSKIPVKPDYIGKKISLPPSERIKVLFKDEENEESGVFLL
jgi:pyrimidine operon attenuation protein/uracil phosphoribosyltransferase